MDNLINRTFKDFENIPGMGPYERAAEWAAYVADWQSRGHWNYRQTAFSGCGPRIELRLDKFAKMDYVSLVSNDYLGFTQHPKVKAAAIAGIEQYGTGAGASPAIGGHYVFHREIEQSIAAFFGWESAIVFTTGYTANSAMLQCLLKKEDLAIFDSAIHASVQEGGLLTNVKTFPHNDLTALEHILRTTMDKYRTRLVVVDGVYSQDGDLAPLDKIVALCKQYHALVMVDDAHGTGVIGERGRGVMELCDVLQEVDIISGTFSKTFAHVGGYVVAKPELVEYLKFHSRQHIFSATLPPAAACIPAAIDLVDSEPQWMQMLWDNIRYFRNGLTDLGLDVGNTASAIIPVKTGDPLVAAEATKLLLEAGVYANQIGYPAVSKKDARVRQSLMATHTKEDLDQVLNAWSWVNDKLKLSKERSMPMTRKKQHKIRDPDTMRRQLIDAIGEILEKYGFTGVRVNNIARHLDRDKNLVRYYFGNIQNLKKAFITEKDYWPPFFERFRLEEPVTREKVHELFGALMRENYVFFKDNKEMQEMIRWQINEDLPLLRDISNARETEGEDLLVESDPFFKDTDISFRCVIAILLGGMYYIVLHAGTNGSPVCSVDINIAEESEALWQTIGQIIDWAFAAAEKAGGVL